jgi:hypothetical protein
MTCFLYLGPVPAIGTESRSDSLERGFRDVKDPTAIIYPWSCIEAVTTSSYLHQYKSIILLLHRQFFAKAQGTRKQAIYTPVFVHPSMFVDSWSSKVLVISPSCFDLNPVAVVSGRVVKVVKYM